MITFPKELIAIRYDGYYWHPEEMKVYSIKIQGKLKPLKTKSRKEIPYYMEPFWMKRMVDHRYVQISVNGRKKYIPFDYLKTLKEYDYELPLYK